MTVKSVPVAASVGLAILTDEPKLRLLERGRVVARSVSATVANDRSENALVVAGDRGVGR